MLIIVGVVTLSVWLVCGGSLSFVILMADVCYNPDEVVRNIFNDTDVKGIVIMTINYYLLIINYSLIRYNRSLHCL